MVYSSRSGRAPRGAASLEVTVAQLFCDAHRVRCTVWRVAPMCSCMFERLTGAGYGTGEGDSRFSEF